MAELVIRDVAPSDIEALGERHALLFETAARFA